jgi:short-subunit dehydrogenase
MAGIPSRGAGVVITGASSGIGAASARAFAEEGARLVLSGRDAARLGALVEELRAQGATAHAVVADVSSPQDCARLLREAETLLESLDIVVANAGIGLYKPLAESSEEELQSLFATNFYGALRTAREAIPAFQRRGRGQIIFVSSILGKRATPTTGGYSATKFALQAASEALRVELRPQNIEVLVVCPGYTQTEFQTRAMNAAGRPTSPGAPMRAETVARALVRASQRGTREVVLTAAGRAMVFLNKWAPGFLDRVLARALRLF